VAWGIFQSDDLKEASRVLLEAAISAEPHLAQEAIETFTHLKVAFPVCSESGSAEHPMRHQS